MSYLASIGLIVGVAFVMMVIIAACLLAITVAVNSFGDSGTID